MGLPGLQKGPFNKKTPYVPRIMRKSKNAHQVNLLDQPTFASVAEAMGAGRRRPRNRSKKSMERRRKNAREKKRAKEASLAKDPAAQQEAIVARVLEEQDRRNHAMKPASKKVPSHRHQTLAGSPPVRRSHARFAGAP